MRREREREREREGRKEGRQVGARECRALAVILHFFYIEKRPLF